MDITDIVIEVTFEFQKMVAAENCTLNDDVADTFSDLVKKTVVPAITKHGTERWTTVPTGLTKTGRQYVLGEMQSIAKDACTEAKQSNNDQIKATILEKAADGRINPMKTKINKWQVQNTTPTLAGDKLIHVMGDFCELY